MYDLSLIISNIVVALVSLQIKQASAKLIKMFEEFAFWRVEF